MSCRHRSSWHISGLDHSRPLLLASNPHSCQVIVTTEVVLSAVVFVTISNLTPPSSAAPVDIDTFSGVENWSLQPWNLWAVASGWTTRTVRWQASEEIKALVNGSALYGEIDTGLRDELGLLNSAKRELMDLQAEYDGLFERGRSLALWLFEHVHGQSGIAGRRWLT